MASNSPSLFSNNIINQSQNSLFGQKPETPFLFNSSLFKNDTPLFPKQNNQNNTSGNIFNFSSNKNDNNEKKDNNPFSSETNIFGIPKNQISKNKADEKNNTSSNSLFQSNVGVNGLFDNKLNSKNEGPENNNSFPLFNQKGEKENKIKELKKEEKNEDIVSFKGIFDKKNEEKPKNLFENSTPEAKKSLFSSNITPNEKKEIKNNLFQNYGNNKEEEKKEEDKKEIKNIEKKEFEKGINIFGIPQKKPGTNLPQKNEEEVNEINTSSKINNINNLSSSKSLEDSEEIQKALSNLYVSDDLLPSKSFNCPSLFEQNSQKKIMKREKQIDFNLIIEIEGITNNKDEGINILCQSNENMSNLMKQVKILIKRKYQTLDLKEYKIFLIKNGERLSLNENEIIGKNIKNKDNIIAWTVHYNSEKMEEMQEKDEYDEKKENNESQKENKNMLCPKDKLPILTKPGYHMNPNEYKISRMTIDEIKNVKEFEIYNENGKIHFDIPVSLYEVNFDILFNINHDLIEYEKGEWCHSPRGKNFNIPATITLYNIKPNNNNISNTNIKEQFVQSLKEKCKRYLNGTFLSYNFELCELKFKTPYFY